MEQLFNDTVELIKKFINSVNPKNNEQVSEANTVLEEIQRRLIFLMRNDTDSKVYEKRLVKELRKLTKRVIEKTNNKSLYLSKTQKNIDYLTWVNKKIDINKEARKFTVAQKEIFYAELGNNIGSEQNGRRPVVILQNNTGNRKGNTTIIAPVTTHKKRVRWDNNSQKYYVDINENGNTKKKYLDFYEVPLKIKENTDGLYGFVNVMHIREIDRKRITGGRVATATDECFKNIINAIYKNLN